MKWYTITQYVDLQTGEQLTKEIAETKYIVKNKKIKYGQNERNVAIKYKWYIYECTPRTTKQLKLFEGKG